MKRTKVQQFKSALCGMLLGILIPTLAFGQATLLPNAKQQYLDDAAQPVASGHVDYYIPSTSTRKTVWSDAAKTTPLPNPVILDAAGRPQPTGQIYGDGSYRQRVVDQNNVTIWDAVTSSTGSGGGTAVAATEGVMVGAIIPWANLTLPAKYLYTAGQAISRTTYPDLFTAITYQLTVLCQLGVATVTVPAAISDTVPLGAPVEFSCFAPGTVVIAKGSGSLTLSTNATVTSSVAGRILPWGNGDGATTFNVPDLRGRTLIGRNNMNSSTGTALSSLYYRNGATAVDPNAVNAVAGGQSGTLLTSNMPSHNHPVIDPGHSHVERVVGAGGTANSVVKQNGDGVVVDGALSTASSTTGITTNVTGGGVAVSATVAAGGSGYTAGTQLLTVFGGTCTTQPQFNVTVAAGAITVPVLVTPGLCSVVPANPAITTGGGGTGGTLNLTYSAAPFSLIQPSTTADYIIKVLPDDAPTTPGVTSIQGMTGAIACAGSLVCTANTISVTVPANGVSSVGGMTGAIACGSGVTCAAGTISAVSATSLVYSSRAFAITQNLSALSAIQTLGYAVTGDGGGATFVKVAGGTPFTDVYITTASITAAGSAYTNGVYQGVALGGGTGQGCAGRVTVAGGVVTLIEISATICPGYSVGDVLTPSNANMGGTGSGATYTVSAISTAVGSFVDSAANRWQIVTDAGNFPNVRQFGAKLDWNGVDATATNDRNAFLAGMSFTIYPKSSATAVVNGGTLIVPKGAALLCGGPAGGFTLPGAPGLIVRGAGRWGGTQLVQCDTEFQNTHFIAICGIYTTRGQFGCAYEDLVARSQAATTASNIAVFYSISGQQFPLLKNVGIIAKLKNCIFYDQGIGGAANATFDDFECTQDGATANDGAYFGVNLGGTLVRLRGGVFECSPTCLLNNAVNVLGTPYAVFDGVHVEGHNVGYNVGTTGGSVSIRNSSVSSLGGPACTAITLQGTNPNNTVLMENIQTGCAKTITNGHAGGADFTGPILKQITCNPGAPCN